MLLNNLVKVKKGYVFSVTALIVGVLLFAYLESDFSRSDYKTNQERIDNRVSQLDREFLFVKDSILPQAVRFSSFYATRDFLNITSNDPSILESMNYSHKNIQDSIFTLAINATFDGSQRSTMENKTIAYLMSTYEEFFEDTLAANFSYRIRNGRVYEKTPLSVSIQMDVDLLLEAKELDLQIYDTKVVDVSFSVEDFKDPNIALNINEITAEKLNLDRTSSTYGGEWTWDLFDDVYSEGYVTTFVFPEYKYSLGNSFLRSFTNSTNRGLYRDIITFLSFNYDKDSTPYDTKNFNFTHSLITDTLFLASFDNVSSKIDETNYNHIFSVSPTICNVSGVSNSGCELSSPIEISGLEANGDEVMISFWINHSSPGIIFNSSTLELEINSSTQNLDIRGKRNSLPDFSIINVSLNSNRWNNIIIHANNENELEFLINSEIRYNQYIEGSFNTFENIRFSNGRFDEIIILNRSASQRGISRLNNERKASFLDYEESLYTSGLNMQGRENINLNLSHRLNDSFSELGVEFWFRAEEIDSPYRVLILENSTSGNSFEVLLENNEVRVISDSFNEISSSSYVLDDNKYKHILIQKTNSNRLEIFINTELVLNESFSGSIGNYELATLLDSSSNMRGIFDEFVIYNSSFSQNEIDEHYFNFESVVGGCCNYFKMYNVNTHGVSIPENNSISATLIPVWNKHNLTLVEMDRKNTSFPVSAVWYGKYIDACQQYVYNINNYADTVNNPPIVGSIGFTCRELIDAGVY